MKHEITNLAASVNQRLLNLRDVRKEDFQIILNRFGLERFLYRLSRSPFVDRLILKGAFSFELWGPDVYRPTRDVDFLGLFEPSLDEIRKVFGLICKQNVEPDGLIFDPDLVSTAFIRAQNAFGGIRVRLTAYLQQIRIFLQFDVGIGDEVKPKPKMAPFPTILPFPAPHILIYPKELTIAEKFHAMCKLGMMNSRVKDYFDIFQLSRHFPFIGRELRNAILTIFEKEESIIPIAIPDSLTTVFGKMAAKQNLWNRFLIRIEKETLNLTLDRVIESIREFILPPAKSAAEGKPFDLFWHPGGPWTKKGEGDGSL